MPPKRKPVRKTVKKAASGVKTAKNGAKYVIEPYAKADGTMGRKCRFITGASPAYMAEIRAQRGDGWTKTKKSTGRISKASVKAQLKEAWRPRDKEGPIPLTKSIVALWKKRIASDVRRKNVKTLSLDNPRHRRIIRSNPNALKYYDVKGFDYGEEKAPRFQYWPRGEKPKPKPRAKKVAKKVVKKVAKKRVYKKRAPRKHKYE